ncbi:MAG: hypothetical protein R3Y60_02175 [bacterium]
MIIKFFPFIQAMIEQSEEIKIENNKLYFKRVFGPSIVEETFDLTDDMMKKVDNLFVEKKELIDMKDVISVNDIVFNYENSSLMYKELSLLLSNELKFKYNPRAFYNENVLFYLGDYNKHFVHHYYQDAIDLINELNLELKDNCVVIDNEVFSIEMNNYQILKFNTENKLYQCVLATLKYKEQF